MAQKKRFALTGATVMLLVGAVALAGALYWVVILGNGADRTVASQEGAVPKDVAPEAASTDTAHPQAVTESAADDVPAKVAGIEPAAEPETEAVPEAAPQ